MDGERFYDGTIFVTNVIGMDVGPAESSLPWDPVASFKLNGLAETETSVSAYLPRRMLMDQFQIFDPNHVRAAVVDENGGLNFIAGSIPPEEEDGSEVGFNFSRTRSRDTSLEWRSYGMYYDPANMEGAEYLLDDSEFGIEPAENPEYVDSLDGNQEEPDEQIEGDIAASKFDFDGDQFANSLLKVSFTSSNFPGEVQFGDPFVDPYAILNESDFGTVTGTIVSESGDFVPEYDVWFFKASEDEEDIYAGEPVFFNFESGENGTYTAKLPIGNYHAEAFGFDPENGTPYKPELALENDEAKVFSITDSDTT